MKMWILKNVTKWSISDTDLVRYIMLGRAARLEIYLFFLIKIMILKCDLKKIVCRAAHFAQYVIIIIINNNKYNYNN